MVVLVLAVFLHLLILAGAWYDTARMCAPDPAREASRPRPDRRLETAEKRLVARRLHGRIDAATYRARMHDLAAGRRPVRRRRPG
jgi:hypothetical protein